MYVDTERLVLDLDSLQPGSNSGVFDLDPSMVDWQIEDVKPVAGPCRLRLEVDFRDRSFICRGMLEASFETTCARCLCPAVFDVVEPVFVVYSMDGAEDLDPDTVRISQKGRQLGILDAIRESVILSLPGKPLCRGDCRGLCHVCGANLNTESCEHTGSVDK